MIYGTDRPPKPGDAYLSESDGSDGEYNDSLSPVHTLHSTSSAASAARLHVC